MMAKTILLISRYFLAVLFISTAIGKLLDNRGFAHVIDTYQLGIPNNALLELALFISLLELLIGINILRGRALRVNVLATFVFHLGYAGLAFITLLRSITLANCGCFGVFLARPLSWATVVEDLVLATVSLTCWLLLKKR
jgi:uncharacterized membrane protein YphA (DoxX/SURF4 family)